MVVDLEKQANILIWDHMKKNVPPGSYVFSVAGISSQGLSTPLHSYSYKYIESSVRAGKLEDLDHHRIGAPAGTIRPVGSIVTAPKGRRIPFTDADDQLLYNWVKPLANQGLETKGNKVYQDIEATVRSLKRLFEGQQRRADKLVAWQAPMAVMARQMDKERLLSEAKHYCRPRVESRTRRYQCGDNPKAQTRQCASWRWHTGCRNSAPYYPS